MLFNSLQFLTFFPIVVAAHFILPHRIRWALLLVASYYFYMCWKPEFALLMASSTLIDYYSGIRIEESRSSKGKRRWMMASLASNLGILVVFKYSNFFLSSAGELMRNLDLHYSVPVLRILLPVGISFYTFQSLAYTINVYRGTISAERHLGIFAVYVAFFPQLVAGPIERPGNLLPQFRKVHFFEWTALAEGLELMVWGYFKKVVIADRISVVVAKFYSQPELSTGLGLLIGTYLFAFQIYCDFSGYSDIARGTARILGYDLMLNFRCPYFAASLTDFWRRWHISLSTWFRDYLYVPLGGNRVSKVKGYINVMIVFVVSGFWHGANWTYLIWGFIHGIGLAAERLLGLQRTAKNPLIRIFRILLTFHLVVFAWIYFRAKSVHQANLIISKIANEAPAGLIALGSGKMLLTDFASSFGLTLTDLRTAFGGLAFLLGAEFLWESGILARYRAMNSWSSATGRLIFFYTLALLTAAQVAPRAQSFIYFQF